MRLTAFLILAACLQLSARTEAQNISISVRNEPLLKVFRLIKEQCGYQFFYNETLLNKSHPVTLEIREMPLEKALQLCFLDQPLTFAIVERNVVIKDKEVMPAAALPPPLPPAAPPPVEVHGHVVDSMGNPLAGASVTVKGSGRGTNTDAKGDFVLKGIKEHATIVFSFTGYEKKEYKINGDMSLTVVLMRSRSPLDEIQVIAYGQTTQRYNVGSISTVSAKEIEKQPVTNLFQALEGRVPGMVVTMTNGAPGAITLTQIRGQNSLSSKSDQISVLHDYDQPLYIIDGVPLAIQNTPLAGGTLASPMGVGIWQYLNGVSPINGINPADIESISILKDADATSIYGSQGSNGVVLITTKRGKAGKDKVDVAVHTGPTTASRTVPMMNTQQYLEMRKEAQVNSGVTPDPARDPDLLVFDQQAYTNWMKEFFGRTGNRTDAHATLSGGSSTTSYMVSGGYTRETYNFPGDFAENRYSMHTSFAHTSADKRFSLDLGTDYSYDQHNSSGGGPNVFAGFTMAPNFPALQDAGGKLLWSYQGFNFNNSQGNPLSYLKQPGNMGTHTLNTHLALKFQLLPSLSIGVNAGYGRIAEHAYSAVSIASQNPVFGPVGYATFIEQNNDVINIEPQLNFTQRIGKGVLTVLLGGTYRKVTMNGSQINANGYTSDALLTSVSAAGAPPTVSNQASYYKYAAGFGRINYIWDSKYIINLTGNRNGSSNFGPGRQFGNFGSAGAGWILTEEKWMREGLPFVSFAKLSVNYGTSGSDGVGSYQYQPNWGVGVGVTYQGIQGLSPINPLNPVYAWSLNKKFNEQLDLGLFRDRLYLNVTTYQNRSIDQLVAYVEPIQTGFSYITANAPYIVQNKGVEITLTSKNVAQKDFQWSSSFNIAHNANELYSFPDIASSPYAGIYVVGKPVSAKIVVPYLGVDPKTGVYKFNANNTRSAFNHFGGDATEVVDLTPAFTGGLGNNFSYKGLSLSVFFQFAKQRGPNYLYSIYSNYITSLAGQPLVNEPAAMLGRWRKSGDQAKIQRFAAGLNSMDDFSTYLGANFFTASTGAYSDASYIRLKNVALSYRLPSSLLKKYFIDGCTFYINAQNLFLITHYELGDPETMSIFSIPPQRTIVAGLNINF